ncbi:MAG: cyclopropane-fatty-acyl-phospholipid synthase [Acidobacteriota bacterium]
MKETIVPDHLKARARSIASGSGGIFHRMARRAVFSNLKKLEYGSLTIIENDQRFEFGNEGLKASIHISNPDFYSDLALGGSIGAAESYMSGFWSVDDLTTLIRIVVRNRRVLAGMERGMALITKPIQALRHWRRRNTPDGSMRNIAAHYDLGNDFYRLWLDRTMTYSCNIYERADATPEDAAASKYERICRKLSLNPSDHVLEIGAGWGGFAVHAVKKYGCRITTTTISQQQYSYAGELVRREGLSDRIKVLFQDYRDLKGTYDKLVSIEMIEAVGHHFLDSYFRICSDRLKADGLMALQAIIIEDQAYKAQLRSPDFIKRYIFPGSFIPSISVITKSVAQNTDMRLLDLCDITPHYARTLRSWRERFFANIDAVRALGYPDSFIRLWEYYLCYCEGAFLERYIGDVQMVFTKPGWRN